MLGSSTSQEGHLEGVWIPLIPYSSSKPSSRSVKVHSRLRSASLVLWEPIGRAALWGPLRAPFWVAVGEATAVWATRGLQVFDSGWFISNWSIEKKSGSFGGTYRMVALSPAILRIASGRWVRIAMAAFILAAFWGDLKCSSAAESFGSWSAQAGHRAGVRTPRMPWSLSVVRLVALAALVAVDEAIATVGAGVVAGVCCSSLRSFCSDLTEAVKVHF